MTLQEIDQSEQQQQPLIRVLQRRFSFPEPPTIEVQEREKEVKFIILSVLSEVINDALKKSTAADQETIA